MKMVNVVRLLVVSLLFSTLSVNAQQYCGFESIMKEQPRDEVKLSIKRNFLNTEKIIPTIIHIIHTGEAYGTYPHIPNETVYTAIDSLNYWMEETGANIQFCLASVGPDGDAISPIQYHNFYDVYNGSTDPSGSPYDYDNAIMNNTFGGALDYLHIYVHQWSGNPQGFATLPPGETCWVKTSAFTNPNSKTLIHEVGHWCGLYHTFGNGFNNYSSCEQAAGESNCTTQGDRVCDTPPTIVNYSCNEICPNDVIESYMSYSSDDCQNLFTQGQIDRMHQQLEALRPDIINNNTACGGADIDLAVYSWNNLNTECNTLLQPEVTIINYGLDGDFIVNCSLQVLDSNLQAVYTDVHVGSYSLIQDETLEIYFDPYTFQFGDYTVIINVNTPGDGWEFNNTLIQDLPLQPFVELNMDLQLGYFPSVQWRLYEWDPETDFSWPVVYSCNWGGPDCWDYVMPADEWPINLSYCLQPGCYDLFWRYTGNQNLNHCSEWYGFDSPCYADVSLSTGVQIFYDEGSQEGGDYHYYFCVEAPDPCPIIECPYDLNGNGEISLPDLLTLLSLIGLEGECLEGDFNFDGIINFQDLSLLLNNYGYTCDGDIIINDNLIEGNNNELYTSIDVILYENGNYITQSELYDLQGRKVNDKGRLIDGIYIVKQYWDNGFITTKKLYLNSWKN